MENIKFLQRENITHVVSVMQGAPKLSDGVKQLVIPIPDSQHVNIRPYFKEVFAFIDEVRRSNAKVLIHCEKGMSRSASFVLAWLLYNEHRNGFRVDYEATLISLRKERGVVAPNPGFVRILREYSNELNEQAGSFNILDPNSQVEVLKQLSPQTLYSLGKTSSFFNALVSTGIDDVWKSHLQRDFKGLTEEDIKFFIDKGYPLKRLYNICREILVAKIPKLNRFVVMGFLNQKDLVEDFFQNNDPKAINDILLGATYARPLHLMKEVFSNLNMETKILCLTYAVAADNLALMEYLNENIPDADWHKTNSQGNNLLFIAAFYGSFNAFRFLYEVKQIDATHKNNANATLLESLAFSTNQELAQYIANNLGFLDPHEGNNSSLTPYQLAEKRDNQSLLSIYDDWQRSSVYSAHR